MTPVHLVVGATASTQEGLVAALERKADQFFGAEPHWMLGGIEVEAEVEVTTMQGWSEVTTWSGRTTFTNIAP